MKREFTPGHFFMNRSLIWRWEEAGERGGARRSAEERRREEEEGRGERETDGRTEKRRWTHFCWERRNAEKESKGWRRRQEKGKYKRGTGRRRRRRGELKEVEEGEEEDGQGRRVGPSTHVGEEEQDPREERDDLTSQPQVVHRGAVGVWRLGGRGHAGPHPALPTSGARSRCSVNIPNIGIPGSLLSRRLCPVGFGEAPPHPSPKPFLVPPAGDSCGPRASLLLPGSRSLTVPSSGW